MAVTLTMTGTSQTISATNGSPNITFTAGVANNWVVGATIQGTGWATGTKIVSITGTPATATAAVLSNNFTGTTGSTTVIASSNNATVIFELGASGDTATPQSIIDRGLGLLDDFKTIQIFGRTYIQLRIAQGAIYDDTQWTYLFGFWSYLQVNETYTGIWRSGFVPVGDKLIKAKGASLRFLQARAVQGGTSIFTNSGAPAGFPTNKLKLQWNDFVVKSSSGSNYSMSPTAFYAEFDNCGDIIFDSFDDTGANASFAGSYGSIEKLSMGRIIGGISTGFDTTKVTNIGKIEWFPIPTFNTTGTNPDIKIGTPNNVPVSGFAPIFHQSNAALEFIGVNSTNTEILDDYILPTDYPLITNSRNYNTNTRTYRRTVTFQLNDAAATDLTGMTVYIKSGANDLVNAVQAGDFSAKLNTVFVSWVGRSPSSGSYIPPVSSTDTRVQTAQFRKYGYQQQSVTYDLTNAAYSQPVFMLTEAALSSISEATAAAITTAGINWSTKTITPTADLTYDQINARIAYELAQTTNSAQADPRTIVGSNLTLATGWTLVVNTGRTISAGTAITYMYVPTVTLVGTGKITGVYASTAGTSTTFQFQGVTVGTSLVIYDASGVTKYFQQEVTTAGTYSYYIPPGVTGTYYWAIEKYGTKRESGSFAANTGGLLFYVPAYAEDVGITQATKATVAAYTALETNSKVYDYVAYKRLSEAFIKIGQITTRSGTSIEWITGYDVKIKATNASVFSLTGTTFYIKSSSLAGDTKYTTNILVPPATMTADTTEVITTEIEDGNGDSSITVEASSVSTFEVWKITDATDPDDYATGTLVDTIGIGKWRFLHADGYKFVIRDTTTNYRVVVEAEKGIYMAQLFFGAAVQLAQAAEVTQINTKVDVMQIDLEAIKGTGFVKDKHSLTNIKKKAALAAALSA